jgi:hypothetical protein
MNFKNFSTFVGHFALLDPDPLTRLKPDLQTWANPARNSWKRVGNTDFFKEKRTHLSLEALTMAPCEYLREF